MYEGWGPLFLKELAVNLASGRCSVLPCGFTALGLLFPQGVPVPQGSEVTVHGSGTRDLCSVTGLAIP